MHLQDINIQCTWLIRGVLSHTEKETMSLLTFCYIMITIFLVAVTVSNHLHVVSRHFIYLMLLFQGHVACRNFFPERASMITYMQYWENISLFLLRAGRKGKRYIIAREVHNPISKWWQNKLSYS